MLPQDNPPSIRQTSFHCPFCGVLASQAWLNVYGKPCTESDNIPLLPGEEYLVSVEQSTRCSQPADDWRIKWATQMSTGQAFISTNDVSENHLEDVSNIFLSVCFACSKISIWVHDNLIFPSQRHGPPPNQDLTDAIKKIYEEASSILQLSPRGASALLRLCIQHLCIHLGEKGENLNTDIGNLVAKGLDIKIQRALDIVRVIGNESVHPGEINLNDDPETASRLFDLVNLIVESMISRTKRLDEMYENLPAGKRDAIEARDNPAT